MNAADGIRVAQSQAFHVAVEGLREIFEIAQRRTQLNIRVLAIQEDADDSLGCARIVDNLQESGGNVLLNRESIKKGIMPVEITCLAKNMLSSLLSCTIVPAISSFGTHLKRNTSPWIGLRN